MTGNPMVTLNRAVAAAMVDGPTAGLALLEALEKRLARHHRPNAVRARLLEMNGDREAAIAHYLCRCLPLVAPAGLEKCSASRAAYRLMPGRLLQARCDDVSGYGALHHEPCEHAFRISMECVEAPRTAAEVDDRSLMLDLDHHGFALLRQARRTDDDVSDLREKSLRVGDERL
jgi:hypothetical protein